MRRPGECMSPHDTLSGSPTMPGRDSRSVQVLVFGAASRRESLNKRLAALAVQTVERHGGTADHASITDFDCPFYDGDLEADRGVPEGALAFCRRLRAADAFMIASPEYNASMP